MCRQTHLQFFLRATISTLNAKTNSPVDTDISIVPCEGNTVPRRTSKEHTEHSSKSVLPWSATSKTNKSPRHMQQPSQQNRESTVVRATTVQCMSRWEGDGPRGAHGGVGVGGHSRAESAAWNVRLASSSAHGGNASTERVGRRGKGNEPQLDETERGRRGEGGKAVACCKKVGSSLRWAKTTWVTTVRGAWVAGSARWKAAQGEVSQGDCMLPLVCHRLSQGLSQAVTGTVTGCRRDSHRLSQGLSHAVTGTVTRCHRDCHTLSQGMSHAVTGNVRRC